MIDAPVELRTEGLVQFLLLPLVRTRQGGLWHRAPAARRRRARPDRRRAAPLHIDGTPLDARRLRRDPRRGYPRVASQI